MKKLSWKLWAAAVGLLVLAGGGTAWWMQTRAPEVSYRTGKIERGNIQSTVSASGAVNPVTQVSVGTQVSGQIKELLVDFNTEVKAGELIALIDPESFEYRVRQSQADVDASLAAVMTAQANTAASRAAVSRARVEHTEAQRDHDRKKFLVEKQFIAQSEADKALALVNTTREGVASAEAQLGVTEAQVKSAQANVVQRQAALSQARVDLSRTRITSPVNGIVIKRTVEKGQTVAASLQSPELFVIAQNLQDMQVEASVDESDVSRIRLGQKASFTVDAFPGQTFEGQIRQVRKAAQTVSNVVTYVAVIGFSNVGGRLLPGMTANVRVVTDLRENALKVPNAALRVRIAGVEPAQRGASATSQPVSGWSLFPSAHAQPAGSGAGGGGGAAMHERLTAELGLTADQQAKLEAISTDMRPQFMALRDLPEEERRAAREKLMGDMRGRIAAMLNAEQKAKYAQMTAQGPGGGGRGPGGDGGPGAGRGPAGAGAPAKTGPADSAARGRPGEAATAPGANSAAASGSRPPSTPAQRTPQAEPPSASSDTGPGGPGGPGGGPGSEFRNRIVAELQLTPGQKEKVDAIYTDARPRFMQLRELPQEERPKARERLMGDIRNRIADLLTAEQKVKYQALIAETAGRGVTRGRIYLMGDDGKPRAYNVRLGITDGTSTELIVAPNSPEAAELKEGAAVIIGVSAAPAEGGPRAGGGPRMPF